MTSDGSNVCSGLLRISGHAGGLSDFPMARVHLLADEHSGATGRLTQKERARYRPQQWGIDLLGSSAEARRRELVGLLRPGPGGGTSVGSPELLLIPYAVTHEATQRL